MKRLEDNLLLAALVPIAVGFLLSLFISNRSRWMAIGSAALSSTLWLIILSVSAGEVSNIWPIAWFVWFVLFCPIAVVAQVLFWKIGRRKSASSQEPVCANCHYNLTGNTSGICPECGSPVEKV